MLYLCFSCYKDLIIPFADIPVYVDNTLDITVSGGVEIHGLHAAVAPKRSLQSPPVLEQQCFVPYTDSPDSHPSQTLQQYASDCLDFTLSGLKDMLEKDSSADSLLNKKILEEVVTNNKVADGRGLSLSAAATQSNSGLAKTLLKLFSLSPSKALGESARGVLSSSRSELVSDSLLSSLSKEEILKPCVDIVLENTQSNKVSIFEVNASHSALYRKIIPFLTVSQRNSSYIAADKTPLDSDAKGFGVKASQWDPSSDSIPAGQFNLLILKNVLHKQADIGKTLDTVSSMVTPDGFILVEEVTQAFPIYLALEALSQNLPDAPNKDLCRMCGCYLTETSWLDLFSSHEYEVVYKKSDKLLSTMFLLRKRAKHSIPPVIVDIDDLQCSWLEELKAKVKVMETAPEDARLWVVAKAEINGLAGFLNCLKRESGGDKVRGILCSNLKSSHLPDISINSADFKALVQKDLVMNIFRDGSWGSFRLLSIPVGKYVIEYQVRSSTKKNLEDRWNFFSSKFSFLLSSCILN